MNFVYDLAKCPASFDFLQWLVNCDIIRWELGDEKLGVAFYPGPRNGFRADTAHRPLEQRQSIFDNVMLPALEMIGAERVEEGEPTPVDYMYFTQQAVEYDKAGGIVPNFRAPKYAMDEAAAYLKGRKPVVINLREASYHPQRNSQLGQWLKFARDSKEDIIFLRDTSKADEPLSGFETCPRASLDLHFRAALMAHAKCTMFTATGPWIMALYSPWPWLDFGAYRPDLPDYKPAGARWHARNMGVPVGEQYPWALPTQRMIWERDDYNVLMKAWEEMSTTLQRRHRRRLNREFKRHFALIKERTAKYGDKILRIDTISMYEGVDDKRADCLVACDVLEHLEKPERALSDINQLANKSIILLVRPDSIRTREWWEKLFRRHLNVQDITFDETGMLACYAAAGMKVEGVTLIGPLTSQARWEHVEQSCSRIKKRIVAQPEHKKKLLLACYGPSLTEYLPQLRKEHEAGNSALVSVSGSHDFLLQNGLVPDYHVECDPRPHKTENLKLPDKRVKYLIASSCHPSYFDKLRDHDVTLWHVSGGDHNMWLIDKLGENVDTIISGGGSVGIRALPLMYLLGYRNFSIYAMDCSFPDDGSGRTEREIWAGPHAGKPHRIDQCKCGDRVFMTSATLVAYAAQFFDTIKRIPDAEFEVWGDGLLQNMCRAYWANPQLKQVEHAA